ncbi:type I restriction endonuclease [Nostoc cycadae]|uniref:Restriction endonuclease n=1 Tax=Nostoc cycadae WK-1 TaxID=1861711 RepID=A0A2H6LDF3_9NOSO|nr:type I restriction endonuclease [Nostoc cycadae]GBE91264.1 restriction endonuclease [Nostoc cycadae WK-1]
MVFADEIAKVAEQVRKRSTVVMGEEAAKMALILPFFSALGYDVFDPTEVIPEYTADFATKRARQLEKVDYAIAINGVIVMIVEAKASDKKPEAHDGQLKKYFNALVTTKVAIVTNGIEYRFFTDLREKNIMDDEPFFCFNILKYEQKQIENLKFFHKDNFDAAIIKHHAEEMVYLQGMNQLVDNLLRSPSEEFIRFLVAQLGSIAPNYEVKIKVTNKVVEKFRPIVKKSIQGCLVDLMTQSISREMGDSGQVISNTPPIESEEVQEEEEQSIVENQVETTAEELEAFEKVKFIAARSKISSLEIKHKDVVSYFGINVGKTNWWFLRLYLSSKKKSFVTRLPINEVRALAAGFEVQEMSASIGDATSRVIISSVNDLNNLSELILKCYETEAAKHSFIKVA